jgi:uncharacterized protein
MIKIKVSNLSSGHYDYVFEGEVGDIDISEPYYGKYITTVALAKYDNQIILDSETKINAILNCDRCNVEYNSLITSKYRMIYLFKQLEDENNDERTDILVIHPETDKIELDEDIRDYSILAIPMKKLCSEDCKGLCPRCGKNLNEGPCDCKEEKTDPRWEPLQELKLKNKLK